MLPFWAEHWNEVTSREVATYWFGVSAVRLRSSCQGVFISPKVGRGHEIRFRGSLARHFDMQSLLGYLLDLCTEI